MWRFDWHWLWQSLLDNYITTNWHVESLTSTTCDLPGAIYRLIQKHGVCLWKTLKLRDIFTQRVENTCFCCRYDTNFASDMKPFSYQKELWLFTDYSVWSNWPISHTLKSLSFASAYRQAIINTLKTPQKLKYLLQCMCKIKLSQQYCKQNNDRFLYEETRNWNMSDKNRVGCTPGRNVSCLYTLFILLDVGAYKYSSAPKFFPGKGGW